MKRFQFFIAAMLGAALIGSPVYADTVVRSSAVADTVVRSSAVADTVVRSSAVADTLVDNLDGTTLDAQGNAVHFTGLVIGSDGRIVQVLHRGDKRPARTNYAIDEHGRIAIPGFVDGHAHVMELGFAALTLDLSSAKSLAEAQGRLAAYTAAHPDRGWIIGRGSSGS